jgi:phasin family protein
MTTTTAKAKTDAQSAAEKMQAVGKETMETVMRTGSEAASKGFEQAIGATRSQVDAAVKGYDDIAKFNRGNIDAFVEASVAATRGFDAIKDEMIALTRSSLEDSVKAAQAFSGARTAKDFVDLQTQYMKNSYERLVATSSKLSEMTLKLTQDSFSPLAARASKFANDVVEAGRH